MSRAAVADPLAGSSDRSLVASGLMLPRFAAFGPPLHLGGTERPDDGPLVRLTWARIGQMLLAMMIGLVVLVLPMTGLAYAVDHYAGVTNGMQNQDVPRRDVSEPAAPSTSGSLPPAHGTVQETGTPTD